jgi:uncharacterized protein (TIGR00369 family)
MNDEHQTATLRQLLERSAFHSWVGLLVEAAGPGEVRVGLDARPEHLNLQGLIHGGLLATLADTAMGLAVRTQVPPGHRHVTIQLSVQFLRAGRPGHLVATGRALRVGSEVAHTEAEVTDGGGRTLAHATGVYSVTALPSRDGDPVQ